MAQQNNRNSPHLSVSVSAHLHNGSAPSSPSMSSAQQQGGQSRGQPASYPSPTSYPSPSLSSAQYNYPPPNNQQAQQHHSMGSNLPPPVAQMGAPYYHNQGQTLPHPSHQYPNVTSDPTGGNMRYALPVTTDSRVMSGGRHKKEIKRRTKTGCLTCRKRRIKCDEAHPACRNCQKSKRECLGYDPIFKQQPGPAPIQPAPSSAPSAGGISATSNPYGNQPQMLAGGYGAAGSMAYDPALSAGVSSPGSASQQYDYTSAIDPALEAVAPSSAAGGNSYQSSTPGMPNFREDLKRDVQSASPYSSGASNSPHLRGGASHISPSSVASFEEDAAYTTSTAKRTIAYLLDLGGPAPPRSATDVTQSPSMLDEVKHLYYSIYAPGLENFLESKWFSVKGLAKLLEGKPLLEQFATLLQQFAKTSQNDAKEIAYTASVEGRVVWALAGMVRATAAEANGIKEFKTVPSTDDPVEASNRLTVFETLLTGRIASGNPLTAPVPGSTDHHRLRELEFWYTLANFVCLPFEDPSSAKETDDTLAQLRNLLDGRENRDVLYSIAVVRALGQRVSEYTDSDTPLHLDESDNKSKLLVAKKFVADEASGAGTTNVIRRLCDLATRSWRDPPAAAAAGATPSK